LEHLSQKTSEKQVLLNLAEKLKQDAETDSEITNSEVI
jgi:hypothetical protein